MELINLKNIGWYFETCSIYTIYNYVSIIIFIWYLIFLKQYYVHWEHN